MAKQSTTPVTAPICTLCGELAHHPDYCPILQSQYATHNELLRWRALGLRLITSFHLSGSVFDAAIEAEIKARLEWPKKPGA